MSLTGWDPVRELLSLQERMNRLIDQTLSRSRSGAGIASGGTWSPAVDLYESERHLILQAELPDVDQDDIHLLIDQDRITIKGERRHKDTESSKQFHRMERAFGPFSRTFTLPGGIEPEKVKAEFRKGILKVTMPKMAEAGSKRIPIST